MEKAYIVAVFAGTTLDKEIPGELPSFILAKLFTLHYNINQNAVKLTISKISLLKKRNRRTFMLLYTLSV